MTDAAIYACWRKHDDKRIGKRHVPLSSNAMEDAAVELGIPYREVRRVVAERLTCIVTQRKERIL